MIDLNDEFDVETQRLQDELLAEMEEERKQEEGKEDDSNEDENSGQSADDGTGSDDEDGADDEQGKNADDNEDEDNANKKSDDDGKHVEEEKDDENEDGKDDTPDFEPMTVQVNGYDVEIKSQEELMAFVQKGAESYKKEPESHQDEKAIIEQANLGTEELTLLKDALDGDMNAIAKIAEKAGIDPFDVEKKMSEAYEPKFEATKPSEIDKAANEILADKELTESYQGIVKTVPEDFKSKIHGDATLLRNFGRHIKTGLAQKIIPEAIKRQIANPGEDFFESYSKVGMEMTAKTDTKTKTKEKEKPERVISDREKAMRDKLSDQKEENISGEDDNSAKAIWKLTDEEFDEKYG